MFIKKYRKITETSNPDKFAIYTKWKECATSFKNVLHVIPWRNSQRLEFVIQDSIIINAAPHPQFIDDYVTISTFTLEYFTMD